VEGVKLVEEALASDYEVNDVFASAQWMDQHPDIEAIQVSNKELQQLSSFKTPNEVMAVVSFKEHEEGNYKNELSIALDFIQDPGNLGTIIRTADWFGIKDVVCSIDTVDCFNPKVVQSSMGSIFRVNVRYADLGEFFNSNETLKVFGAKIDGEPLSTVKSTSQGSVLLLGNESKGISSDLEQHITSAIAIEKKGGAESLNVATAAAILCHAFTS